VRGAATTHAADACSLPIVIGSGEDVATSTVVSATTSPSTASATTSTALVLRGQLGGVTLLYTWVHLYLAHLYALLIRALAAPGRLLAGAARPAHN
jgi:hypothetical protein